MNETPSAQHTRTNHPHYGIPSIAIRTPSLTLRYVHYFIKTIRMTYNHADSIYSDLVDAVIYMILHSLGIQFIVSLSAAISMLRNLLSHLLRLKSNSSSIPCMFVQIAYSGMFEDRCRHSGHHMTDSSQVIRTRYVDLCTTSRLNLILSVANAKRESLTYKVQETKKE